MFLFSFFYNPLFQIMNNCVARYFIGCIKKQNVNLQLQEVLFAEIKSYLNPKHFKRESTQNISLQKYVHCTATSLSTAFRIYCIFRFWG